MTFMVFNDLNFLRNQLSIKLLFEVFIICREKGIIINRLGNPFVLACLL